METIYRVTGYIAHSQRDSFEGGCYGECKTQFDSSYRAEAPSFRELINKLAKDFSADWRDSDTEYRGDFILDCCEEPGRLDAQVYEVSPFGRKAGHYVEESWKKGERDLWLTCYSFQVEVVVRKASLRQDWTLTAAI